MNVQILGPPDEGTCCMTGKTGEVWLVQAGGGDVQQIGTKQLLGVLRLLTAVAPPVGTTTGSHGADAAPVESVSDSTTKAVS